MDPQPPRTRLPRIRVLAGGHLVIATTILLGILAAHTGQNVLAGLVALLLAFQAVSGLRSSGATSRSSWSRRSIRWWPRTSRTWARPARSSS